MRKKKEKKRFFNVTPDMSEYGTIVNIFHTDYDKASHEYININYGIMAIEKAAFKDIENLREIIINDSVRAIESQAFMGCIRLSDIKLPKGLTEISSEVFLNCKMLNNVALPDTVRKIGSNAFTNCQSLTSLKVPASVRIIGAEAFSGCTNLKELVLPKDLISCGNNIVKDSGVEYIVINRRFKEFLDVITPDFIDIEEYEKDMLKVILKK